MNNWLLYVTGGLAVTPSDLRKEAHRETDGAPETPLLHNGT
jgi:hypothetical protein